MHFNGILNGFFYNRLWNFIRIEKGIVFRFSIAWFNSIIISNKSWRKITFLGQKSKSINRMTWLLGHNIIGTTYFEFV